MVFGTTPLSTTVLSTNQFPVSAVAEPGLAGGNLTALEGGPGSVDSNGNRTAPASMYIKGGSFIDFGAQADAVATSDTGTFSYMALVKRALQKLTTLNTNTTVLSALATDQSSTILRVSNYGKNATAGDTPVAVDSAGRQTSIIQAVGGTALGTDQSNTMLKVSMYGTNAVAGDTAFPINASGNVKVNISGISGGVTFNTLANATATQVGSSDFHLVSAASTNATNVKASAGQVYGYDIFNTSAAARYVKLYNSASAPTAGSGTPLRTIGIAAGMRASFHTNTGIKFSAGIGFTTVTGVADSDATAVAASDLVIELDWL